MDLLGNGDYFRRVSRFQGGINAYVFTHFQQDAGCLETVESFCLDENCVGARWEVLRDIVAGIVSSRGTHTVSLSVRDRDLSAHNGSVLGVLNPAQDAARCALPAELLRGEQKICTNKNRNQYKEYPGAE